MSLSNPRTLFGIHQFSPYSRSTGEFYGTIRVLASSSMSLSGDLIQLNGGSQRYPWDIQDGTISAEISLNFREYPNFLFELFLGKAPTTVLAETAGNLSTAVNVFGTSIISATAGIASVTVTTAADLKFGKYIIKAITATTVDLYASTDVDFRRGTDQSLLNDALKINAAPISIATDGAQAVTGFGITLTGGSGTIALVAGQTAEFYVSPISLERTEVTIGSSSDVFPEFGAIIIGEQKGGGELVDIEVFRCKALGLPLNFNEKAFSEAEVTAQAFFDSAKNAVFKVRYVRP